MQQSRRSRAAAPLDRPVLIGMRLAPLTDDLRKTYGLDQKVKGVVVTSVEPKARRRKKASRPAT